MRILLTNFTLGGRTGTEIVTRDFAIGLMRRGHQSLVFSPRLGPLADELRAAGVPVVDRLERIADPPRLVHGNHHAQLLAALLRFPESVGVLSCHDWQAFHSVPFAFPRLRRYIAVDEPNGELLSSEHGVPAARVRRLANAVDLGRFRPRAALPPRPARALVFNNNLREESGLGAVREACRAAGLALDVVGAAAALSVERPEDVLPAYDVVFAVARSALEALAAGCAVVLCDHRGLGPLVSTPEFDELRRANFGFRVLREPVSPEGLLRELARYDAEDAARVRDRVRAEAGLEGALDGLVAVYEEALAEAAPVDADAERRAVSDYLEEWERRVELATWREQEARGRAAALERALAAALASAAAPEPATPVAPAPAEPEAAEPETPPRARRGWLARLRGG